MALSPMMVHYQQVKEQYKDCIVFYRLGDFYEMFFDDAIKVSTMLDLTLTGRDCGLEERAPMCGIPFHAADTYISKLVALGEKVAICEQLTEPTAGKTLVERDVIKIVTAGTVIDGDNIDEKSNNFICSVCLKNDVGAIAWADITTGEFFAEKFEGNNYLTNLSDSLLKISPSEIICNDLAVTVFLDSPLVKQGVLPRFSQYVESEFDILHAFNSLCNQFGVISLSSFGLDDKDYTICPAGALVSYLKDTQRHALKNINFLKVENSGNIMMLDNNAIRNLELVKTIRDGKRYGTLLWLLDKTKTSMGARKLQNWILSPLNDIENINYRLDGVQCFYNNTLVRQSLIESLSGFKDIGRLSGKISNNNLLPRDCLNLYKSLSILPEIKFRLVGIDAKIIQDIDARIKDYSALCNLIQSAISDKENDGYEYIKSGFNGELDELRDFSMNGKKIISQIESKEREKTGIKTLKIGYNRVFGYYIEVTNSFKDRVPFSYQRKQTIANAERYVTDELKELEVKILSSEEKAEKLELKLYNEIKQNLSNYISDLKDTSDAVAELDVLLSFAIVAKEHGYNRPVILKEDKRLNIIEGRHPVVEATSKSRFIPNDCLLDCDENRTAIITGPNMAGKSTYMRQTAIIVLMAHCGAFVPAREAEIPIIDRIFTRIGASDSLISDQSTFMVEMSETAYILKNATKNSLIILDEIGRGTSTFDGLSIAWSVVEYITKELKAKTLFATHYHELTELEGVLEGVKNYKITVKEMQGSIVFLRKILRGSANKSFGIEVASLAGVNQNITDRAKEILKTLESSDITKKTSTEKDEEIVINQSEVERIISDIDINNLTPMDAFGILSDLKDKVEK